MSGTSVSIIVVVSFLISVFAFVASQISAGRGGHLSQMDRYKQEIEELRTKNERLQDQLSVLQNENYALMRKLLSDDGSTP